MAQKRLPMRKVRKILEFHFDEGHSARAIATHCGLARRSVAQTLARFAAYGLSWPEAAGMDDAALEAALYPARLVRTVDEDVDWAKVEKDLSARGVTLKLLWGEWRETRPDGMSYVTWCRRFREWRPATDVTMRQNRRPGERLFVDYAGMTVPVFIDGIERDAELFVASMGVSGRIYSEATLSQKIDDWCGSHVRCFEDMGLAPQIAVPDNHKAAVTKPSRNEPVLNETYADLLGHYGVLGLPARAKKPRDKALVEHGVLHAERWILAPLRNHVFHDLASLNRAIADRVREINGTPYADGTGESRSSRFESVDAPHMKPLPDRRWQRVAWRENTVHPDYHIAIDRHFYSVPYNYVGKKVDVRLRGRVIDVFHRGKQIASHLRSDAKGRATTLDEHKPEAHQRADVDRTRAQLEDRARDIGPHVHAFVIAVMGRNPNPEFGFRSCYGVLRLAGSHGAERLDNACRYALDLGTRTWRGLDSILRTGADLVDGQEPETRPIKHSNLRGPEYYK
ncbi:MAG: IS21 family transposase [Gammaproteobacteria bacterium]|nr:IS21 family transposase [Gammaproteobacteria bacterium]MYD02759.1 IS21 family transposase [Gammaproteobacteria bacterium]